jgi:hypothetical protein
MKARSKRTRLGVAMAAAAAWSAVAMADGVCNPTLCNGVPPTFETAALPTVPVGGEVIVALQIRGQNAGTYHPYTDPVPRADDAREIHLDLDIDSPTRRDAQRLVIVRFGKCLVSRTVNTCYIALRGVAPGTTMLGLKAFDKCVNERCPGESSRILVHHTYTTRAFALRVGN